MIDPNVLIPLAVSWVAGQLVNPESPGTVVMTTEAENEGCHKKAGLRYQEILKKSHMHLKHRTAIAMRFERSEDS